MLYNLLPSRPLVMLPTCWQHVANMFAKWSLGLTGHCSTANTISGLNLLSSSCVLASYGNVLECFLCI